jgi:hypothetical protein
VPASTVTNTGFIKCPSGRCSYAFYAGLTEHYVLRRTRLHALRRMSFPRSSAPSLVSVAGGDFAGGALPCPAAARAFLLPLLIVVSDLRKSLLQFAQNVGADLPLRRAGMLPVLAPAHRPSPFTMATVIAAGGAPVIGNVSRVFP